MDEPQGPRPVVSIEFIDVVQSYGRKTPFSDKRKIILNHINLRILPGDIMCLVGPSGCGKTTMVDLVMGIRTPLSGKVYVMGELAPYPVHRQDVGYMPQHDALYGDITAEENLRFFGAMYGLSGKVLDERVEDMLRFGRLENHRNRLVSAFSGGMKRRLSLGIALIHDPNILVLDEPTVGLDPDHRRHIWNSFERLCRQGKSMLVTTHVMDEASRCSKIVMLRDGAVIAQASPNEILTQSNTENLEEAFLVLAGEKRSEEGRYV